MSYFQMIITLLFIFIGALGLMLSLFIIRYFYAYKKAEKFLRRNSITDGIYARHGMVTDPKTRLVRGTSSPSHYAVKKFMGNW